MKKVKVILQITLPVILIVGVLAVSGHAKKPPSPPSQSKPEPVLLNVTAKGAIEGDGAPANIAITLSGIFQGTDANGEYRDESGSFIANPDYPPAFTVYGNNRHKRLSYYYCDSDESPHSNTDGICDDPDHDPLNYKNLRIYGGILDKNTGDIVFPKGST